jgi:hypothetical protein
MWMDKDRGGMGWIYLYDEITSTEWSHGSSMPTPDEVEHQIAAAAVLRSEGLTKSSYPLLEDEAVRPWDGTMMGRIMEWMTGDIGKYFQI